MTTIITRIYSDEKAANAVADALRARSFPESTFDVVSGSGAADKMQTAKVGAAEAGVYGPMIDGGNALVVVRAPFTPFGAARTAMQICDAGGPVAVDVPQPNRYAGEDVRAINLSNKIQHGYWGGPAARISRRAPRKDKTIQHRAWGRVVPHLLNESNSNGRGRAPFRFSSGLFGFPTIKHRYWANIPGHILNESNSGGRGHAPFRFSSGLFGIPTKRDGFWGDFMVEHLLNESNSGGRGRAPFRFSSDLFGIPTLIRR